MTSVVISESGHQTPMCSWKLNEVLTQLTFLAMFYKLAKLQLVFYDWNVDSTSVEKMGGVAMFSPGGVFDP